MEYLIDLFLHLDVHLAEFVAQYGIWVYAGLFAVIFAETGLVVTPFLPGDSLLFAAGALASSFPLRENLNNIFSSRRPPLQVLTKMCVTKYGLSSRPTHPHYTVGGSSLPSRDT